MLIYIFSNIIFLSFISPFTFWLWLEFNIIVFIILTFKNKTEFSIENSAASFFYFLVQRFSSILLLFYLFWQKNFCIDFFIVLILFLKSGIVPFHYWVFKLAKQLISVPLVLMLTVQKFPIMVFFLSYNFYDIYFPLVINLIFSFLLLFYRKEYREFLVSSRICSFNWFLLTSFIRILGFIFFFIKYLTLTYFFVKIKNQLYLYFYCSYFYLKIIFLCAFMCGLPPLFFFFTKYYVLRTLFVNSSILFFILLWIFSFVCLASYFKFFFFFFFFNTKIYLNFFTPSYISSYALFYFLVTFFLFFI